VGNNGKPRFSKAIEGRGRKLVVADGVKKCIGAVSGRKKKKLLLRGSRDKGQKPREKKGRLPPQLDRKKA